MAMFCPAGFVPPAVAEKLMVGGVTLSAGDGGAALTTNVTPTVCGEPVAPEALIVTVDTGPLHLAGAIGVPTVGMLPYAHCWRWTIGRHPHTADWYDSVRLFLQAAPDDWTACLSAAAACVTDLARP